ncbi:MAG: hypothetical protein KY475_18120 [Planctomycetes bacterium]|nr:hypothetical protein [Planctomycetota bacterium]
MAKSILLIHGRHYKPPEDDLKKLWLEALRFGISRDFPAKVADWDAAVKEFVYYGNVSNEFLSEFYEEPIPNDLADRRETLEDLKKYKKTKFTRKNYNALPGKDSWKEAIADALAGPLSFFGLSNPVIEAVAPDMREYWNPDSRFGSDVRLPMIAPLKSAMGRDDEILVISHSLGTMIAYEETKALLVFGVDVAYARRSPTDVAVGGQASHDRPVTKVDLVFIDIRLRRQRSPRAHRGRDCPVLFDGLRLRTPGVPTIDKRFHLHVITVAQLLRIGFDHRQR